MAKQKLAGVTELFPAGERIKSSGGVFRAYDTSRQTHEVLGDLFTGQSTHFRGMLVQLALPTTAIRVFDSYTHDTIPTLIHVDDGEEKPSSIVLIQRPTKDGDKWLHHALLEIDDVRSRQQSLRQAVLSIVGRRQISKYDSFLVKSTFTWMYGEVLGKVLDNSCYTANRYGHYLPEVNVHHRVMNPGNYLIHHWAQERNMPIQPGYEELEDQRFRKGIGYMMLERELVSEFVANGGQDVTDILAELMAVQRKEPIVALDEPSRFALAQPMSPEEVKSVIQSFELVTLPQIGNVALRELADTIKPAPKPRKRR